MQVSQRQAAAILGERLGIPRRAANRLLAAKLAGEPARLAGALLYDRAQVEALASRPPITRTLLPDECAEAILLARTTDADDPLQAVTGPTRFSVVTRALIRLCRPPGQEWTPLVVTMHHFVVAGAEVLDTRPVPDDHPAVRAAQAWPGRPRLWTLETRPPGSWFESHFAGRVLQGRPGNRHLLWHLPRVDPPWLAV